MDVFEKSLAAVDNFLLDTSEEDFDKLVSEIRMAEFEGPTIKEFYNFLIQKRRFSYRFQKGIHSSSIEADKPDHKNFNLRIKTPGYSLESFFSLTSQHGKFSSSSI